MLEIISLAYPGNLLPTLLLFLFYILWIELRRARERRDWTAEEAAEHIGIDVRTYLGWERGEHQPRPMNKFALQRTYPELDPSKPILAGRLFEYR